MNMGVGTTQPVAQVETPGKGVEKEHEAKKRTDDMRPSIPNALFLCIK